LYLLLVVKLFASDGKTPKKSLRKAK